jgi:hypothetical protein
MLGRRICLLSSVVLLLLAYSASGQVPTNKVPLAPGIVMSYFDDWYLAMRYRNGVEFWTPSAGAGLNPLGKLVVTTEQAPSHGDAVRRLTEIAGELPEPVQVMATTGWPAISARRLAPPPRSDEKAVIGEPNESLAVWITTAMAVGDLIVRADATVAQSAGPALADQAETIEHAINLPQRDTTEGLENELNQIRQQRHRAPPIRQSQNVIQRLEPQPSTSPPPSLSLRTQPVLLAQPQQLIEPEIAASADGENIVVAAYGGISFSKDGGKSFMTSAANGSVQNISAGTDTGDYSIAYGKSGQFFISFLHYAFVTPTSKGPKSVGVATSPATDGGHNFAFLSHAILCRPGNCDVDQPHIAADAFNAGPDGGDQVYVVWQSTGALTCSSDGGQHWSEPIQLSAATHPRLTVGRDGQVYVVFRNDNLLILHKFSSCKDNLKPQPGFPKQILTVNDAHMCPIPGLDRCNGGNRLSSHTVAVDENNPKHVYLALANTTTTGNEDIIVFDSVDGGLTFPRQVKLNGPETAHRFMPWMCTTGGAAFVSWYDRSRATPAQPDLTDYLVAGASLQPGILTAGTPVNVSGNPDPQCLTAFPSGVDVSDNVSVSCVPPQIIGTCANSSQQCSATLTTPCPSSESCTGCMPPRVMGKCMNSQHSGMSSGQPCCPASLPGSPVNQLQCPAGVPCNVIGKGGGPKYGDYSGNACAAGKVFVIWSSKTPPPGIDPAQVTQIRLFSATMQAGNGPVISAVSPNQTPCGTAVPNVTITGTNFIDVTDVTLVDAGGVMDRYHLTDVNVVSTTQITVTIPDTVASGPYDIVVHTPNGSSITPFDAPHLSRFLVPPIVNGINPASGPATGGTEVTVNGTCFHSDMRVTFGSNEAAKGFNQCASSTQCTVFSPAAVNVGPVDVVASVGEARSAIPSAKFSYVGPVVQGISPSSGPITGGTSVEITGSGFPRYDGITALNTPVSFDGARTMAQCNLSACSVATPPAVRPGPVHVIATAFGASSTPFSAGADVFTYNQFPELTQFRLPDPFFGIEGGVFIDGNAPAGDAMIMLNSSDPNAVSVPRNVIIPEGTQFTTVPLTFTPISRKETVTLTAAYQGSFVRAILDVSAAPPISLSILDGAELDVGQSAPGTVTLNTPAPPMGANVMLASSDSSAIQITPQNVPIRPGEQTGMFTASNNYSGPPKTVTITATYSGESASISLTVPTPPPPPDICRDCRTPQQCCVCNGGTWVGGRCQ